MISACFCGVRGCPGCGYAQYVKDERDRLSAEVARLTAERDEARRDLAVASDRVFDLEHSRVQVRVEKCIRRAGLDPSDCSGNESGDPLDYTSDQIDRALSALAEERDEALDRLDTERRYHDETRGYRQHAENERDVLKQEVDALRGLVARLNQWAHTFDKDLIPTRADTYGDGMREAKYAVSKMLRTV